MRKTKAKNDSFWRSQMLPFVLVWTISMGLVSVIARLSQSFSMPFLYNEPEAQAALTLFISGIGAGLVQVFLVERLLKRPMRGWMMYTTAGVLMSMLLNPVLPAIFFGWNWGWTDFMATYGYPVLTSLALHAPIVLLQALWLRQRVYRAWLWPLMSLPLLMAFTAIPYNPVNYDHLKIMTLLCIYVVQAGLMHTLWQHPKDAEKARIDFAEEEQFDATRIERLQDGEHSAPRWDQDDDQALQRKAL